MYSLHDSIADVMIRTMNINPFNLANPNRVIRTRRILIVILLCTLPCYCLGIVSLRFLAIQRENKTQTATSTQTASTTSTFTLTITASQLPTLTPTLTQSPTATATTTPTFTQLPTATETLVPPSPSPEPSQTPTELLAPPDPISPTATP